MSKTRWLDSKIKILDTKKKIKTIEFQFNLS